MDRKVAIVTGASRGIGRAIALRLAHDGHAVVVNYARGGEEAENVVQRIEAAGGRAHAVQADIAIAGDVRKLFDTADDVFGGLDILVNNAGAMQASALADVDDEDFERQFAINVRGVFFALREAAQRLRDGVNFSSTTLALNAPGYSVYNGTKGAVEGFSRVVAKELGARGITVNVVAPGPVETDLFLNGKSEADVQRMAGMAPLRRIGAPPEIADVVAFLVPPTQAG